MRTPTVQDRDIGFEPPKIGDKFRCDRCGMEIEVTKGCDCPADKHVHFHCCGEEMLPSR